MSTITALLPAPTGPSLEPGPLPGDFYACEDLLSGEERNKVQRIREFARTEIAPIVDDYWARAEFHSRSSTASVSSARSAGRIRSRRRSRRAIC